MKEEGNSETQIVGFVCFKGDRTCLRRGRPRENGRVSGLVGDLLSRCRRRLSMRRRLLSQLQCGLAVKRSCFGIGRLALLNMPRTHCPSPQLRRSSRGMSEKTPLSLLICRSVRALEPTHYLWATPNRFSRR